MSRTQKKYKIAQDFKYEGDDWWSWWIWIEANDVNLDEIDHVVYTLHPTFHNPVRKVKDRKSKFRLETEGWGTFVIYAKVILKKQEKLELKHSLHLVYPDGTVNYD